MSENEKQVVITLGIDDALDLGVAMALAEYISRERFPFEKCHRIANIVMKAISEVFEPREG